MATTTTSAAPDLAHAQAFLTALDEGSESWSFQTFADDKKSGNRELIRLLHGSLDTHGATLAQLNECGAGIFVTVNKTDEKGRKKGNITRIRALFVDLDGAPIEPVLSADPLPSIVVESSSGRFHAYWRVADCPVDVASGAKGDDRAVRRRPGLLRPESRPAPAGFSAPQGRSFLGPRYRKSAPASTDFPTWELRYLQKRARCTEVIFSLFCLFCRWVA